MRSFEHLTLTTPRLLLRPLVESDAAALFVIFSDARVMRYWSSPPWVTLDEAHKLIARDRQAMLTGDFIRLGLELLESNRLIGTCTLFHFHESCRRAEVGYGLAADAWGQGFMNEALVALLNYAFIELNLHRVEADIDPRNTASARCLTRLGFQQEGLLRERWIVGEEISDAAFYGLLRHDWKIPG